MNPFKTLNGSLILQRWLVLDEKIGSGSFGVVYKAKHVLTMDYVAIKFECKRKHHTPQLEFEYQLLLHLDQSNLKPFVPKVVAYGELDQWYFMVMQLLRISLAKKLKPPQTNFKKIALYARGVLQCLQSLHDVGYIHCDVKPANFMLDKKHNKVVVIDMGLSRRFKDNNAKHLPLKSNHHFNGTPRFASVNIHNGCSPSRRDDLIGLCYMIVYWNKGSLPWQIKVVGKKHKQRYSEIRRSKKDNPFRELCRGMPSEICKFTVHCETLHYTQRPNYKFLYELLDRVMNNAE